MKIKNVIFDVGGVLLDWNPIELLRSMFDETKAGILKKNMMDSPYWAELDRGAVSVDQAVELFSQNIPELRKDVESALKGFVDYLPVIEENVDILYKLSNEDYNLYVLSNFHLESFEKARKKYAFFGLFDGLVISSRVKMIKPNVEIYEHILNKFALDPSETVFFDDSIQNIETALELNIIAVHTPTTESLQAYYEKKLKKEK